MQTRTCQLALLLFAAAVAACESDSKPAEPPDAGSQAEPEPNEEDTPDAAPSGESDAGSESPSGAVPLTVWVDDLIDHRTSDEAEPDTVDDKVIRDDTDESSFDKYLP